MSHEMPRNEFYLVQSYRVHSPIMGYVPVLCIAMRIDGMLHMYFTTDRTAFLEWIESLNQYIPPANREAIAYHASQLRTDLDEPFRGTTIITGWAAMGIISAFQRYYQRLGDDIVAFGWELGDWTMDTNQYLTQPNFKKMAETGEPMLELKVPQDAYYVFTDDGGYVLAIIYSWTDILYLAGVYPPLEKKFIDTIPLMQLQARLPEQSPKGPAPTIIGRNSFIGRAAAQLACSWIRVVRTMMAMGH